MNLTQTKMKKADLTKMKKDDLINVIQTNQEIIEKMALKREEDNSILGTAKSIVEIVSTSLKDITTAKFGVMFFITNIRVIYKMVRDIIGEIKELKFKRRVLDQAKQPA